MVASTQHTFEPPAIPWLKPQHLLLAPDLGIGLDYGLFAAAMERLSADPAVHALIVFGSRGRGEAKFDSDLDRAVVIRQAQLTPAEKASHWRHFRELIGPLGAGALCHPLKSPAVNCERATPPAQPSDEPWSLLSR